MDRTSNINNNFSFIFSCFTLEGFCLSSCVVFCVFCRYKHPNFPKMGSIKSYVFELRISNLVVPVSIIDIANQLNSLLIILLTLTGLGNKL